MENATKKTGVKDFLIGMIVIPRVIYGMVKAYYLEDEDESFIPPRAKKTDDLPKISKNDLCAGVLFWTCVAGLLTCAGIRGCQEVQKHWTRHPQPQNIFAPSNFR